MKISEEIIIRRPFVYISYNNHLIFDIEFHKIKSNDIDLGGDINLQMISPMIYLEINCKAQGKYAFNFDLIMS